MKSSRLVYSTSGANTCPRCQKPLKKCQCAEPKARAANHGVTIQRERKGRGGKEVTVIRGLTLPQDQLKQLSARLKSACGTGGTVKDGQVEIQGDHREKLQALLHSEGIASKLSGG